MGGVSVRELHKSFGGRDIFAALSFDVPEGARLAVVGPNGSGKSTLLRILAGEAEADRGEVRTGREGVGYAAQEMGKADLDTPLLNWVLSVFPSWSDFWSRWERAVADGDEAALKRLGAEQAELEASSGYNPEHKAESVLMGLGFEEADFQRGLGEFSGGWRERAKLARVILQGDRVLLLDEPTNHLDLEAVEWLEEYLKSFDGALVFVAHDRVFLDNVATHVLALETGGPVLRKGNFSHYLDWAAERDMVRERQAAKIEAAIDRHMTYISRFRVKARKAAQAQSKLKKVEKMQEELEDLSAPASRRTLSFSLPEPERPEKVVARAEGVSLDFGQGPLWRGPLTFQIYRGQRVALAAPNGAGKSSLLKVLTGDQKPTSGVAELGRKTKLGFFSQHQAEALNQTRTVVGEMRSMAGPKATEEELRSVLGLFLLGEEYFDRPVSRLSGGEKSRLALAGLFMGRCNFLVLDEPTNHLDLESREALVEALRAFPGTMLLVAHDRYLLREVAEEVWALSTDGLAVHLGGFEEYERCRKAEKEAPACPAPKAEVEEKPRAKPGKQGKEERRRRAEARAEVSKELTPRKDRFQKLEAELEEVANRQSELEAIMAEPSSCADQEAFLRMSKEYENLQEREERIFEEMAGLETEIAGLEERKRQLLEGEA
ncbi:ribosomal protection-like ABC-F family protein [Desulfohalovibrio reitneri]|uniref:ribosomal protection-like ABC-F family protein n=1 Tax=Desulfohalovibrio reitneri TaxID=1307759 RepID=UPI0004A6D6D5|nr:ABC-F family ATP-binding cassette domain-containing protein [Desulfohalovibrio reitneri]